MNATIRKYRDEIVRLAREHGAYNIRLFGSAARGDERPDSDLDLLVDMEPGRSLVDHVALKQDLEDLLEREVDVVTGKSLHPRLRDKVLREAYRFNELRAVGCALPRPHPRAHSTHRRMRIRRREAFEASHVLQDAIMRNFEVIGEAVKQLSPALLERYPEVPWRRVAGFRDVLIHNYMGVDLDEVWNVIEKDLPQLKRTERAMQEDVNDLE